MSARKDKLTQTKQTSRVQVPKKNARLKWLRRALNRHSRTLIEVFFLHSLTLTVIALMMRYELWLIDTVGLKGWHILSFEGVAVIFLVVLIWDFVSLKAGLKKQ